jgi:hypothetical protein
LTALPEAVRVLAGAWVISIRLGQDGHSEGPRDGRPLVIDRLDDAADRLGDPLQPLRRRLPLGFSARVLAQP